MTSIHATKSRLLTASLGLMIAAFGVFDLAGCQMGQSEFRDTFSVSKADLVPEGGNTYFRLDPGRQLTYQSGDEVLTITVLNETVVVDGVTTRVIEEREEVGGQLREVSRNFFAADPSSGDVYYFGEEVDIYENGQIINHEGAWRSGIDNARFGLIMPAEAILGDKYYQEIAPDVALDRAEVVGLTETVVTPAGTFENCLHIDETSPLETGSSHKWYAPGVGLVRDGDVLLSQVAMP